MPTLVPLNLVSSSAHPSRYISLMEKSVLRVATRMYNVFMKQEGKYMKDRVVLFVEMRKSSSNVMGPQNSCSEASLCTSQEEGRW
jgi:hypothetical protein